MEQTRCEDIIKITRKIMYESGLGSTGSGKNLISAFLITVMDIRVS
jgi:hypothetical protein